LQSILECTIVSAIASCVISFSAVSISPGEVRHQQFGKREGEPIPLSLKMILFGHH
jgi:hypothetical protein